jgi:hypothetical protein
MGQLDSLLDGWEAQDAAAPPPPDGGLAQLAGIGDEAAAALGETRLPQGVAPYDEDISSARVDAVADLYYICLHESLGVFAVVRKLQELFRAGSIRLSDGPGAYMLFKWDRREVLRYTRRDRLEAYRRAFGYGRTGVPLGSRPNTDFHPLFVQFTNQVALYWRDKRISDVMRERAYDPAYGSIAVVRRAGLDLRNNVKFMSFGHINVLRVEVMQLLDEAFRILDAEDTKNVFGAGSPWDVVEEVLTRYFNARLITSPRQRMAVTGRNILRWLAQPHVLQKQRGAFEALLLDIAEDAEEWITSAQSLGEARRTGPDRVEPVGALARAPARARGTRRPLAV